MVQPDGVRLQRERAFTRGGREMLWHLQRKSGGSPRVSKSSSLEHRFLTVAVLIINRVIPKFLIKWFLEELADFDREKNSDLEIRGSFLLVCSLLFQFVQKNSEGRRKVRSG